MKPDEIGVSFFPSQDREISPESKFKLIDRPFQTGDVCKRHIEDVQSGVVKSVDVRFKAAHVISNEKVKDWLTKDDIEDVDEVTIGSIVIYGDWVGQVRCMQCRLGVHVTNCMLGARGEFLPKSSLSSLMYFKIFDEMVVEVGSGGFVRVPEMTSRLTVGDRGAVSFWMSVRGFVSHSLKGYSPASRSRSKHIHAGHYTVGI